MRKYERVTIKTEKTEYMYRINGYAISITADLVVDTGKSRL